MNLVRPRLLFLVALSTLLLALPGFAGKRRAVEHPTVSTSDITGIVLDSVSGAPVVSARVEAGGEHVTTNEEGRFVLRNVDLTTPVSLTVDRTGYASKTVTVSFGNSQNLTIQLAAEPTASLQKTDGTVIQLDYDSVVFGFLNGFSGYIQAQYEDFCLPDGSFVEVDRSKMKRLIGPAVRVAHAPCCKTSEVFRIQAELRAGALAVNSPETTTDVYFDDSCSGYPVDVIGRNHATGVYEYIPFTDTAELVFPATPATAARTARTTRH